MFDRYQGKSATFQGVITTTDRISSHNRTRNEFYN